MWATPSSNSCTAMLFTTHIINPLPRLPCTLRLLFFSLSVLVACLALCNKHACSEFRLNLLAWWQRHGLKEPTEDDEKFLQWNSPLRTVKFSLWILPSLWLRKELRNNGRSLQTKLSLLLKLGRTIWSTFSHLTLTSPISSPMALHGERKWTLHLFAISPMTTNLFQRREGGQPHKKVTHLEMMLGQIANYAPIISRNYCEELNFY